MTLGAAAPSGTINWYDSQTSSTSLATGTSFTTPALSSTTNTGTFSITNTLLPNTKFKFYRVIGVTGTSYYGGVLESRFVLANSFVQSQFTKPNCLTGRDDADLIPNHLDLDSDSTNTVKYETISGVEFLKRFLDHIVPPYFHRIRHLGFLSTRNKKQSLENIRESLQAGLSMHSGLSRAQVLELRFGERSVLKCKACGGKLQLLETFARQRAPPVAISAGIC